MMQISITAQPSSKLSIQLCNVAKLYISTKRDGNWSTPERLAISDSIGWDGSPAFSRDGKTLYFSSNRRGGKGGLDLYRAPMDNSGRFGRPINLGSTINTRGNEIFPYVSEDGKLYFSSDGHPSLGGLDLFVASRSGDEIQIEHLGLPINSVGDDFGLFLSDSTQGYFSSNRVGGKGDDDIYYFESKISAFNGAFGLPFGAGIRSIMAFNISITPIPVFPEAGIISSRLHPNKSTI